MMARKYFEDDKKDNGERWLLTYSDLITLLLALFIIMYGMSSEDSSKLQNMSSALSQAFNGTAEENGQQAGGEGSNSNQYIGNPVEDIYTQLSGYVRENKLEDEVDIVKSEHSVSIHLKDSLLFQANSSILNPDSMGTLEKVSDIISQVYEEVGHITITGNTADLGNRDAVNEADSWQLSVDRAVKILMVLTSKGLLPDKLSIEGNSHYHPIGSNDSPEGRAANRRVDITIMDDFN